MNSASENSLKFSRIQERDLAPISALYAAYYNAQGDRWSPATAYKRLHQMWAMVDAVCVKATHYGTICALAMGYLEQYDKDSVYHLLDILVLKEFQHQGIGTKLINEALHIAASRGAKSAYLEALNNEGHTRFYQVAGFFKRNDMASWKKNLESCK